MPPSSSDRGLTGLPSMKRYRASIASRPVSGRSWPMTAATSRSHDANEIICAISEARGISPTVGLSFINVSTCEALLCQILDTQTFARTCHKMKVISPTEILFANSAADLKMLHVIRENLEVEDCGIRMTQIDRRYWSESIGHDYIQQLAFPADLESLKLSALGSYFANCCFGAVMKYVTHSIGITFAPHTLRIRFEPSEGSLMIDVSSIASLEILQNVLDPRSKDCLFGVLNETLTRMGSRTLRNNILQPSTNVMKIGNRYGAVEELCNQEVMLLDCRLALQDFVDTDKVLAALVIIPKKIDFSTMEQAANTVIMLKTFIDRLPPLCEALASASSKVLQEIRDLLVLERYADIKDMISYALNEDIRFSSKPIELRHQRVWALNAGLNGFLDVARQTYKEVGQDVEDLAKALRDQYDIDLDLKFDPARQYFLRMRSAELENKELPDIFINVHRKQRVLECQTMDLLKLNQKLREAHNETIAMSDQSIQELIAKIRPKIHSLFQISEAIALLDMLCSFARTGTTHGYVKPELTSTLAIHGGRHPIKERLQTAVYVPNDVYATQQSRFQIVTGCNMSGKSTYIRSIALMTIMAQIGCYVPAQYASFPVVHQMFARVSTDDTIEGTLSTFACEMREMASILHNIESRSLVIVDELGRGTSTTDGLTVAIAISEALVESKALVWFVTHFRDLPRILAERAGVVNLHLNVDIASDFSKMKMMYKIAEGIEEVKLYGIALARLADLPPTIIERATELSILLDNRGNGRKENMYTLARASRRKLVLQLREQLVQARESKLGPEDLRLWLRRLQEEFAMRMNAIDAEVARSKANSDGATMGKGRSRSDADDDFSEVETSST